MNRSKISTAMCSGMLSLSLITAAPISAEIKAAGPKPPMATTTIETTVETETTESEALPPAEPLKVRELAEKAGVSAEKVNAMRAGGLGWGEIKAAISLAQRISSAGTTPVPVGEALDKLLAQRQAGMGWGKIAQANGFKLGEVIGKGHEKKGSLTPTETMATPPTTTKLEAGSKIEKPTKPEKPEKISKPDKPEKIDKPEKLEKPEKIDKPDKPEKPEKPEHPAK